MHCQINSIKHWQSDSRCFWFSCYNIKNNNSHNLQYYNYSYKDVTYNMNITA